MSKLSGVFIDLRNSEHVKWWNEYARKKVRTLRYTPIIETATGKEIGRIMVIAGLHAKKIFKENDKFLGKDLVEVTSKELEKFRRN